MNQRRMIDWSVEKDKKRIFFSFSLMKINEKKILWSKEIFSMTCLIKDDDHLFPHLAFLSLVLFYLRVFSLILFCECHYPSLQMIIVKTNLARRKDQYPLSSLIFIEMSLRRKKISNNCQQILHHHLQLSIIDVILTFSFGSFSSLSDLKSSIDIHRMFTIRLFV